MTFLNQGDFGYKVLFFLPVVQESCELKDAPISLHLSRKHHLSEQKQDPTISSLFDIAVSEGQITEVASCNFLHGRCSPA